jgi:RHS repeat-associated protein
LSDNASGVGKDYYVGRIGSKTTTVTAYGDTKKAKTVYTFENNLPKTVKTFNQDETQSITETYTYDGFGNVIEKNVTNSKDSQTQKAKSSYDSKGLFVTKSTDNLDLITLTTYNDLGQVLTQTDPLGNTITNTYDAWGKLNTSNSNLSGTTSYTYQKLGDDIIATQNDPTGDTKITYTNKKGEQYLVKTKGFASGSYIAKQVIYDAVGRKVQESEPYYDTESPKWNVLSYDDSVFPAKVTVTGFNGKKLETEVKGLTTTIKELNGYNRTTRKTTDVLGNVKESEDKGGVIKFTYNAAGQNTEALYGSNSVTTKYDTWGRKSEFNDPSNGKYVYEYDGFGTLTKETSPKGTKEFQYNTKGQLVTQIELSTADSGKATNKTITLTYNAKGMVIDKSGTANGKAYQTYVTYDTYGRVLTTGENSNGKSFFRKNIAYDDKSRVISYDKGLNSSGVLTQVSLQNVYSTWSGILYQVNDKNTAKVLWQLKTVKANGQVLKANLGAVAIENKYDGNNFLTNVAHASTLQPNVLKLTYAFDAIKNELKNRARTSGFAISEVFTYDDNNRLTSWTNPKTGLLSGNTYDEKGRILDNDQTGKTTFKTDKIYQADKQELNAIGVQNFANNILQTISYNENNDPIYIDGLKGDALFSYGLTEMRQMVTYGGNFAEDKQGKFTKYYSEDGSYEITTDNTTGKEKHIMYIGGSPYESDIIYVKNYTVATAKYLFLHKDYLGSILAITDDAGNVVEQRHFDAWGNLSQGVMKIIDRGYTSHEHFDELGIIHMNGRLYDPLQRRFLNADENIQDPGNTQCYNKYGYVMNNPLLFNDPNGEEPITLAAVAIAAGIAAFVGVASYAIGSYIANGSWERVGLSGTLKAAFFNAVTAVVTYGIGSLFSTAASAVNAAANTVTVANAIQNAVLGTVLSFIPPIEFQLGDWGFSISPSIALGNSVGFGASLSVTYSDGNFSFSGGIGFTSYSDYNGLGISGNEFRKSAMIGYDDGKTGFSLGTNAWSGMKGVDGESLNQRTGMLGLHFGNFRFSYENDGAPFGKLKTGDGNDSYRTAAIRIGIGEFSAGFNLFTGRRDNYKPDGQYLNKGCYGNYGTWMPHDIVQETGHQYRMGAAYIGYGNSRVGINSDKYIRHPIQDLWAHDSNNLIMGDTRQPGFDTLSNTILPYFHYQTRNPFTSW